MRCSLIADAINFVGVSIASSPRMLCYQASRACAGRLIPQRYDLLGAKCGHRVRLARIIAEFDFVEGIS